MIGRKHIVILLCVFGFGLGAQTDTIVSKIISLDGEIVTARVQDGDTLIIVELEEASVTSFRNFDSDTQYRRYMKYRRYANTVYAYAVESIKMFRKVERETEGMNKRKRKKYVRGLQKDLKKEFTDPLKSLSRTQGKILIKMIEYELDTPMYNLLKNVKSGFSAAKWQTLGKLYGYNLKEGYIRGDEPLMDAILQDFDISYE